MKVNVTKIVKKIGFQMKKHAPEILTGTAIGSGAAAIILSNKTTYEKFDDIRIEHEDAMIEIRSESENIKKDTFKQYAKTAGKLVKAYGPALACGTVSVACTLGGYKIQKNRNIALAGAYAALDQGFKKYREEVKERYGEEIDKELRAGVKKNQEVTTVDENGKEKTKKANAIPEDFMASDTSRFFDSSCADWVDDPEANMTTLRIIQNTLTEKLSRNGYLFLNDVYDTLGFEKTNAGQRLGWKYDPSDTTLANRVDFGIYQADKVANRRFVHGLESVILLEFNYDGDLYLDK